LAHLNCKDIVEYCNTDLKTSTFPSMKLYNPSQDLDSRLNNAVELPLQIEDLNTEILGDLKNDAIRTCNYDNFHFEIARAKKLKRTPLIHIYKQVYSIQ